MDSNRRAGSTTAISQVVDPAVLDDEADVAVALDAGDVVDGNLGSGHEAYSSPCAAFIATALNISRASSKRATSRPRFPTT